MLSSVSSFQPIPYAGHNSGLSHPNELNRTEDIKTNENAKPIESEKAKVAQKAFDELSQQDQQKIQQLKKRDLEVKAHEQAHLGAAGSYSTGAASYTYTSGPDGKRYATGGEVGIDTSKITGDPAATIRKADAIRRASLAPASPSSQDQLVARKAMAMAESARIELIQLDQDEQNNSKSTQGTKQAEGVKKVTKPESVENSESEYKDNILSAQIFPKGSLLDFSV